MRTEQFRTQSADYKIYLNEVDKNRPFTIFLHGGPGFNVHGERALLGPYFHPKMNFIWFDLLGCAESPATSPKQITWENKIGDIARIIGHYSNGPVNVIGHCLGAHLTHDLVRGFRDRIAKVVWYSPAGGVVEIFKGILTRALVEGRLDPQDLTEEEKASVIKFNSTPAKYFGGNETLLVLKISQKIKGFQELYWTDPVAMAKYIEFMTERPFSVEVFCRMQTQFFERGPLPVPSYEGIPLLMLYSEDDKIAPWELNGKNLLAHIPDAKSVLIPGGSHWTHYQKTKDCAEQTIKFFMS